jgi:hypothetical protein
MSAIAVAVGKPFTTPRMSGTKLVFSWIGLALGRFHWPATPAGGSADTSTRWDLR